MNFMSLKTMNISGHAYFVTSKVINQLPIFVFDKFCQIIISNLDFYRNQFRTKILGYVIMPDHIHLILWPQVKYTVSDFLRNFKEYTAKEIIKTLKYYREALAPRPELALYLTRAGLGTCPSRREILISFYKAAKNIERQTFKLWQSRNWIENIYSEKFLAQKLNYIHNNPVRAKMVKEAKDYPYSSFQNYYQDNDSLIKIDKI